MVYKDNRINQQKIHWGYWCSKVFQ